MRSTHSSCSWQVIAKVQQTKKAFVSGSRNSAVAASFKRVTQRAPVRSSDWGRIMCVICAWLAIGAALAVWVYFPVKEIDRKRGDAIGDWVHPPPIPTKPQHVRGVVEDAPFPSPTVAAAARNALALTRLPVGVVGGHRFSRGVRSRGSSASSSRDAAQVACPSRPSLTRVHSDSDRLSSSAISVFTWPRVPTSWRLVLMSAFAGAKAVRVRCKVLTLLWSLQATASVHRGSSCTSWTSLPTAGAAPCSPRNTAPETLNP